jgi:hypothetical protein
MMESEKKIFEMMDEKTEMSKYWMPLTWATNIINRARKESLILNDHVVQTMLTELSDIRRRLGSVIGYDTVCVPLVYTQVSGSMTHLLVATPCICLASNKVSATPRPVTLLNAVIVGSAP